MKLFQGFKLLEFSKKLAVVVTILYTLSLIFTFIAQMVCNQDLTPILEYVQYSFTIVLGAYLLKSGVENITKIKVSDLFKKDCTTDTPTDIENGG